MYFHALGTAKRRLYKFVSRCLSFRCCFPLKLLSLLSLHHKAKMPPPD